MWPFGYREVLGAAEGMKEDKASWVSSFQWLRGCGLDRVKLVVGDKCFGMLYIHRELARPGMTLTLLWEGYCAKCQEADQRPYMSTQFAERYRLQKSPPQPHLHAI